MNILNREAGPADAPVSLLLHEFSAWPAVQPYFRDRKPPTLIESRKNDKIFPADGAHPYKRGLSEVESQADAVVPLIRDLADLKVEQQ